MRRAAARLLALSWRAGERAAMYAIALIRYRRPLEDVLAVQDQHRAYLRSLKEAGTLIASGPLDPRAGGALLLRVPDDDAPRALDAVRDGDPYVTLGVAQYELLPWAVNTGREDLDRL
jgi:uncharacterized protein YciI